MNDLFKFNSINVDPLTETYQNQFYERYLASWSELCLTAEAPDGRPMGYGIMHVLVDHVDNDAFFHGHTLVFLNFQKRNDADDHCFRFRSHISQSALMQFWARPKVATPSGTGT